MGDRRVLLVQLGECPEPVRARFGGFHRWFEEVWGGPLAAHDARAADAPALDPRDWDGILLTGSASSCVTPEPWMDEVVHLLRKAYEVGTPTLGVCFGHQLLGLAFGATVIQNPFGWEVGTAEVTLSPQAQQDPLFAGLGGTLRVNMSHQDVVDATSVPAGSPLRVLATNALCDSQVLAVGDHVRGVQFHPEFRGEVIAAYMAARRERLAGLDVDALIANAQDCPDGVALMANFRRNFVERG